MKQIKSIILTLLTALLALPASAQDFEYEGIWYTVLDANAKTARTRAGSESQSGNDCEGEVTIPATVSYGTNDYEVVEIGKYGFRNCKSLTSINIPDGVTSIGFYAFSRCSSLLSINIPDGVTSIGSGAFSGCSGLTSIAIPAGLTSIENSTFFDCSSLTSITIPDGVTSIKDRAFSGCSGLTSINIPDGVTSIENSTFSYCSALTSINIPDGVTSIGSSAFWGCSALTSISIPDGVTSIGDGAFVDCNSLTSVTIPDGVTSIDFDAFLRCSSLISINIPDGVTSIGSAAFSGCSGLNSINIPDGVTSIGSSAFSECSSLTSINIPDGVTSIEYSTFSGCSSLTSINIPDGVTSIGIIAFSGCSNLTELTLPESLTSIGESAFSNCRNLTSINIPAGLISIDDSAFSLCNPNVSITYSAEIPITVEDSAFDASVYRSGTLNMPNATLADIQATVPWNKFQHIQAKDGSIGFGLAAGEDFEYEGIWYTVIDSEVKTVKTKDGYYDSGSDAYIPGNKCEGEVTIPATVSDGTSDYSVEEIGNLSFYDCSSLTAINIPAGVKSIGLRTFYGCSSLTSINIPEGMTSIGDHAFENCTSLTSIEIPAGVISIGISAFYECSSLTSIDIPASVTSIGEQAFFNCSGLTSINIPDGITTIGPWTFCGCSGLTSIIIPESVTIIEGSAFSGCSCLSSINIPDAVTYIDVSLFKGCISLTSISIPDKVTSIGEYAFSGCSGLTSIVIPDGVTYIGHDAFEGCSNLTSINIPDGVTLIGSDAFSGCSALTSINIPGGVELQRSQRIFSGCSGLTSIKYDAAIPVSTFENNFNDYIQPTLYMPNATLADIQATVPWNKFQHIQAKDGSIGLSLSAGDDFIYDNIAYTVIDAEAKTVKTKEGSYLGEYDEDITPGNGWNGELTIPSTVTDGIDNYSVVEIGFCSFYQNDFLTSVTLPESLRTIEMSAFQACSNLTTVNLNDSLETIKPGAFVDCGKLQSISLPASLTSIEGRPFNGCDMMSEVTYKASSPIEGNENLFSNTVYTTATLNMPNATLESVQAISPWNKFLRITASDGSVAPAGEGEDFEYDGITYTVIDVENRTCRTKIKYFNSPDSKVSGDLDIPAIVSDGVYDYTVVEIGRSSFRGAAITSLTLPESITNIGENAFSGCDSLKTVNLPASMPSVEYGVFGECRNIRKVNYAAASPVTAAENLFDVAAYCMAILSTPNATLADVEASVPWNKFRRIEASDGSLNVPLADGADFEYEGLWYTVLDVNNNTVKTKNGYTSDGSYFSYNKAEGDLVIPAEVFYENQKYTVEAVGDMGFLTQTRITSVVFPNTLKTIGLMAFKYCADLNSITFPESLTKIDADAFSFCTKLEEIVLPDNLTVIERSDFSGCTALTSVKLPNSLTRIGDGAFHSCKNLTSVSFPSSLKKIGAHAFNTCNSLTSITLPDSLTSIVEYAFEKCINLTKIYLPASIEYMDYYIFRGCDNISDVTYEAVHPVTAISSFSDIVYENATLNMPNAYLSEIETVEPWNLFKNVIAREGGLVEGEEFEYEGIWYTVIDSEAKTVKTRDGQDGDNPGNHFEGALTIPATVSYDNSDYTVVEIGHHGFCSLSGLTSVAMPATVVKLGEAAFNNCENLASVELPDSLSEVEGFVFDTCVALASIKLPEGLEYVGERMFAHCHSLTSATLPSTIKEIRGWAFGDANLSSIDLPEGLETIGGEAFAGNKNITSISFPDNVTAIWDRAFSGCGLTSLILPESLQSLGDGAFYHNYELESIVLPASITSIGLDAFGEGDDKLDSVTYNAEEPIEANSGIFGFTGELYDRATLTMPNATLAAIQAVTPWNLFKRINANDGSIAPALPSGEDFVYNGITYTVIDSEAKTVKTQDRWYVESKDVISNEMFTSDLEIPSTVTFDGNEYTVVEIGNSSFFSCSPLTAIKLPSTLKTIGEYAFDTSNLTSIIVPEGVDSIKLCAFRFCDRLTTVHLPSTLRSIGGEAFKEAKKLSSINFPEGLVSIEHGAFYVCEALTEVHLPASLVSIGNEAFGADSNLTVLEFKEGLKVIGTSAFWGTGITSVTLPASLTDIGDMAFSCYFINEVNYNATIPIEAPEDLFYSAKTNIYETATLNMPNATLESVQATMPWKKFLRITASDGMVVPFASEITLNRDTVELKVGESLSLEATVKPDYATDKTVTWTSDNEDVATVDAEGKVTAIALGEATITATSGEVTATCKVTVVPTPVESITLSVDTLNLKKGETATLTATIAPEDVTDKTVAWTSDNEEVATVDAEGKVTAIALGEATITAASGEVTATCKVTVIPTPVESITLSVDTLDLKKGETAILTATVAPEDATDKTVTWTSDNEEVATVDSEGKVTAIALGEATITATSGEVTATCKVTVVPTPVESITLSNTSLNIVEGDKATLTVTITPDDATDKTVTWTSSDASVATVSANGEVTAVKVGTATITATSANGKTATCTVTVAPKIIDATDLTLNRNTAELKVGETLALEATVIPENATDKTVTWSSSDTSVATVDSIGKVTAIALGEVTITATSGEVTATCKVTVVPTPVESITLSDTSLSLIEGDTATLTAAVTPDDATDKTISWTSSDASVATVSANGEVTAVNAGTATITAATSNGMTATCTVTVAAKIIDATDLTLSLNTAELKVGETVTLEATVIPDNATDKTVTWKSDNEEVATVDSNGMVTAVSLGEATITAACGQVTATCKVTVVPTPVESITLSATSLDLIAGETAALTATVTPEDATDKTITWTSDNEEVASVSESGEVIAVKAGTATITVTSSNGKTATCTVTVAKRTGDFEYEGLWFTIIDDEAKTCRTKAGSFAEGNYTPGNDYIGDLSIPATTSDGVYEYSVVEIGRYGFATVTGLTSVSIPNTVSSVSEGAFYDCPALKTVDLSGSLKSLESMAFSGCNSNVAVTYRATTPIEATEEAFDSNAYKNGTLNTPNATLASVQAANPWRLFFNINASDGSISVPRNGEDFEIGGIIYTVVDDEDNILRTKEGDSGAAGNNAEGNFVIPGSVTAFDRDYTVTEIGDYGFSGNSDLLSVTIPVTVTNIGTGAFSDCERLTSLVWLGDTRLQSGVVEGIGNPNLLVYVNDLTYAPEGLDHNIVAGGVCDNLVLTPGYPFTPLYTFTANHSEITKEFTQQTPIEGCAGWETLAIPFEPTDITAYDGRALVPFAGLSDIDAQCPFWLYEADAEGEWKEASAIRQGVPYLVSMPDNDTYDEQYRIHGDVTFSTDTETVIAPETTVPYITTWASGREFRSLWLPLDAVEAANAMGLNVGIDDLTNDDGELLQPGSAFHVDVLPLPLEAYVTNIDGRRSMPVRGDQSFIKMISDGTGLRIAVDLGKITLSSDCDRSVDVVTMDGILLRRAHVKAGVAYKIENLTRGIYIVAGRKITVK